MAYTNETIHYGIPKPLGTDLTVPMDYNDAADAVDQALFDASTNATEAVTAAANAVDAAADAVEEVGNLGTEVNNLKGRTSALETSDIIQNNKIDALENQGVTKFDSAGIADPYVNGLTYSVGDVVTYNGQRYICITAVVAAEPFDADKWSAEDVETVLDELKSDLADKADVSQIIKYATYTTTEAGAAMQPNTGTDLGLVATLFDLPIGSTALGVIAHNVISGQGGIALNVVNNRLYAFNISNAADYILANSVFTCLYI